MAGEGKEGPDKLEQLFRSGPEIPYWKKQEFDNWRRQEFDYWKKHAARIRGRNLVTGLCIGAFVVGMFSYTILSVKQERILDEIDDEARIHITRGPRTGANS
ncbi:cytochrome c oxidase assembly factor 3 homolog, mitochondrial [Entelurus aequoreus]|uniref:cytochrome c oxidase assembly factor 3 homolog, mitochondrial n=1 Tax=Entelurus aequoreus TaxID=161455 RepID=UPI002B1DB475|nr:cytochrome c oxidase assembly factor 3 homolog, mitochondrial [Entelurus aequoreus]